MSERATLRHAVMLQLHDRRRLPDLRADVQRLMDECAPGAFRVYDDLALREGHDRAANLLMTVDFASEEQFRRYLDEEGHKQFLAEWNTSLRGFLSVQYPLERDEEMS